MRYPNPWVAIPSLAIGVVAGWLGYVVTDVSCSLPDAQGVEGSCPGWAIGVAVTSFLLATAGMAVIIVLVYRSIAEARERERPTGQ